MSPGEIKSVLLRDMRGVEEPETPLQPAPQSVFGPFDVRQLRSPERPLAESISIKELRHKVPKEARGAAVRGKKWSRAGEHSKAAEEQEADIKWDPEFVTGYNALGVEYERGGRLGVAAAAFGHVVQFAPRARSGTTISAW